MNTEQSQIEKPVQERYCMQCSKLQTQSNKLRCPLGPGWQICQQCLTKQAKILIAHKQSRPRLYPEIQMIVEGLYLGNEDAACDQETIQKYQIRAICTCGSYLLTPFENQKMEGKFEDVRYIKYDIADFYDQQIDHFFDSNCDWIDKQLSQGRNVLIHCAAGVSRSASFTIAYLMNRHDMLYPDAMKHVKERRRVINPNSGFRTQLQNYGKQILDKKLGSKYKENHQKINQFKKQKQPE